jgi:hypothetical protein
MKKRNLSKRPLNRNPRKKKKKGLPKIYLFIIEINMRRCQSKTKAGRQCKNRVCVGCTKYCQVHKSRRRKRHQKGGAGNSEDPMLAMTRRISAAAAQAPAPMSSIVWRDAFARNFAKYKDLERDYISLQKELNACNRKCPTKSAPKKKHRFFGRK